MDSVLPWVNACLAVTAFLAAFGSLNKMKFGQTRPCVGAATLLILLGLGGQVLGIVLEDWQPYADTALFAGIAALLIASQRVATWIGERWANPLASVIACIGAAALAAAILSA